MNNITEINLKDVLASSERIQEESLKHNPYKTVVAFSGGDDSLTVFHLLIHLGIKVDYAIFADTQYGFPQTLEFVKQECVKHNIKLLVTKPTKTLDQMVYEDGFVGLGNTAHNLTFGNLKGKPMRDKISEVIRQGEQNRNVIIYSGIRRDESTNRSTSPKYESPFWREKQGKRKDGTQRFSPNIWTSIILHWSKDDCMEFLEWKGVKRNPISIKYGRSGDCHCGTAIGEPMKEFNQLKEDAPLVAKKISQLNQHCIDNDLTQWCEPRSKERLARKNGQCDLFDGLDLCRGCKNKYELQVKQIREV